MMSRGRLIQMTIIAVTLSVARTGMGADQRTATTLAKWETIGGQRKLTINVSDLLTPAQREIVNSGFSTFTLLAISEKKIRDGEAASQTRLACSVKYDTWEERYQMIRVDPPPVLTLIAKDYKMWADECLRTSISDQALLTRMTSGGTLNAILQIRQSSPDEAAKIKSWLVQQQSGFMQGLFSHMLGDFQFKGTINININVPEFPVASGPPDTKEPQSKTGI